MVLKLPSNHYHMKEHAIPITDIYIYIYEIAPITKVMGVRQRVMIDVTVLQTLP